MSLRFVKENTQNTWTSYSASKTPINRLESQSWRSKGDNILTGESVGSKCGAESSMSVFIAAASTGAVENIRDGLLSGEK